jgi:hypothetical protein
MPDKVKTPSRANTATPGSMDSRKESLELLEDDTNCDEDEFDDDNMNVRIKFRGLFMRVNIFGVFKLAIFVLIFRC